MSVIVRDVVAVPPSSNDRPMARLNFLIDAGDGSGRLFVNDMNGRIYVIKDEKVLPEPFLDMAVARKGAFTSDDQPEQGLAGFAFHPDFAKPGRPGFGKLYTSSTETPASGKPDFPSPDPAGRVSHQDVLTEWTVDPRDPNRVDVNSRREVLRLAHPLRDHVMCQLAFARHPGTSDPDYGMLYIGVGDGGDTVPPNKKVDAMRNAQNRLNPFAPFAEVKLHYLGKDRSLLEILGGDSRADLRFGLDERGEIYLLTKRDGMIRKLSIPAPQPGG